MFKNFKLVCNGRTYAIEEVEFNYHDDTLHSDPYVKYDEDKLEPGNWYFNKHNGKHTKGLKRGINITIGSKDDNVYGTVLIRSIYDLEKCVLIECPDKVLDELVNVSNFKTLKRFIGKETMSIRKKFNANLHCSLINSDMKIGKSTWHCLYGFYKGPRVGLKLKKGGIEKERFIMRPYRFMALREKKVKVKGKRVITTIQPLPQTMLQGIILNKYFFGIDELTLETLKRYGIKEDDCNRWMAESEEGGERKYEDFYNKELNDKEWMQLYRLWINTHGLTNPMREYDPDEHKEIDHELLDNLEDDNTDDETKYVNNFKLYKESVEIDPETNKEVTRMRETTREEKHQILNSICGDKRALNALLQQMSFEDFKKMFEIDTVEEHNERKSKAKV
jgi:hypothetical protein